MTSAFHVTYPSYRSDNFKCDNMVCIPKWWRSGVVRWYIKFDDASYGKWNDVHVVGQTVFITVVHLKRTSRMSHVRETCFYCRCIATTTLTANKLTTGEFPNWFSGSSACTDAAYDDSGSFARLAYKKSMYIVKSFIYKALRKTKTMNVTNKLKGLEVCRKLNSECFRWLCV